MKKTNFLKGLGAKLALAVVAFGAVLTSCTKEEFNVGYKANNAQIYFNPTVIDAATNTVVVGATLTGAEPISGTPDIEAGSVTITATMNEVSGSATVAYAKVPAGSVVTYSPVILLSSEFTLVKESATTPVLVSTIQGQGEHGHSHDGSKWNYNASDYFAKFTPSWSIARKNTVLSSEVYAASISLKNYIQALNQEVKVEGTVEEPFMISAWGMYRAELNIYAQDVTYNVISKATEEVVAVVVVNEPVATAECRLIEKAIPSHAGDYHAGHGHGENTNAGGGITWAE